MNIQQLISATQRPALYTPGTASMWVDEHISRKLLEVHLNQETDLASRKKSTILLTIDWISRHLPGDTLRILDLGCGPGLYAEELAGKGHLVTGLDISAGSIAHARESAQKNGLDITYLHKSYLELDTEDEYDLVILIFTDFGVLTPSDRTELLTRIHRSLKPGGKFIFDILNDGYTSGVTPSRQWEVCDKGFWRKEPYLTLSETFHFKTEKVVLDQHVVIDENGKMETYRFWMHTFSHEELNTMITKQGFTSVTCFDGVLPDSELYDSNCVTFCIAEK